LGEFDLIDWIRERFDAPTGRTTFGIGDDWWRVRIPIWRRGFS